MNYHIKYFTMQWYISSCKYLRPCSHALALYFHHTGEYSVCVCVCACVCVCVCVSVCVSVIYKHSFCSNEPRAKNGHKLQLCTDCNTSFYVKIHDKTKQIPSGSMIHIVREYNTHFNETPNLTINSVASKKFPTITRNFSNRWHPSETKHLYLSTFSISEWNTLASEEKTNHTLRDCQVCQTKYQHLSMAFPGTRRKPLTPLQITFSPGDLSTPQQCGSNLLTEANSLTKHTFNKPVTDVIEQTPKS